MLYLRSQNIDKWSVATTEAVTSMHEMTVDAFDLKLCEVQVNKLLLFMHFYYLTMLPFYSRLLFISISEESNKTP